MECKRAPGPQLHQGEGRPSHSHHRKANQQQPRQQPSCGRPDILLGRLNLLRSSASLPPSLLPPPPSLIPSLPPPLPPWHIYLFPPSLRAHSVVKEVPGAVYTSPPGPPGVGLPRGGREERFVHDLVLGLCRWTLVHPPRTRVSRFCCLGSRTGLVGALVTLHPKGDSFPGSQPVSLDRRNMRGISIPLAG